MTCQLSMISAFDFGKRTVRTCGRPFGFMRGVPSGLEHRHMRAEPGGLPVAGRKPPAPGDPDAALDRAAASRSRQVGPPGEDAARRSEDLARRRRVDRWAGSKLPGADEVWSPHPPAPSDS